MYFKLILNYKSKMKNLKFSLVIVFLAIFMNSCSDDTDTPDLPLGDYEEGYFIANEGPFQNGTGTVTFVGDEGIVTQNIYQAVNNEDIGNILNSMTIVDDKIYLVVNNSNKILVVNKYTMVKEAEIKGNRIVNPRYLVVNEGKGYISNWGDPNNSNDDFITVISLDTNAVLETIPVDEGPEKMIIDTDKLYVCLQGGYGFNNKVVVIDTNDNSVETSLTVGDVPNSIVSDSSGNLWVLCSGKPSYADVETAGYLYKIVPGNNSLSFFEYQNTEHPSLLNSDSGMLYYSLNGKVFKMDETDGDLPSEPIQGLGGFYRSMVIQNGELFATDPGDYASEGSLKIYNIASGELLETIGTGIVPAQVVFP